MGEYQRYWNLRQETLSEKEYHLVQEKAFLKQLAYVWENSTFYQQKFSETGLALEDISGLDDLKGMKVGVVEEYYTQDLLSADYPELSLTTFKNIEEALMSLSKGSLDAFVNDMASTSYAINSLNIPNLNVAAMTPYSLDLSIGVRKDWPELIPILEKAIETVTPQLADDFKEKWLSLKFTVGLSLKTVLKWALPTP